MPSRPNMSTREMVGTTIILTLFGAALGVLCWFGRITLLEIAAIIAIGGIFIGGSVHLYKQMWDEEEW